MKRPVDPWAAREAEILAHVNKAGRISAHWTGEHQARGEALRRLIARAVLRVTPRAYPWSDVAVIGGVK